MKWSFASVGLIILGLTGIAVIILFQQVTTNNENDYYLLKEVTEAAMIDAIDIPYYRDTGNLKIVTEKFVENFTRRFSESTIFVTNDYKINFYDIIETPPKVSIVVNTGLGEYTINGNSDEYNIANKLDAILEYTGSGTYGTSEPYISHCSGIYCDSSSFIETYYVLLSQDDDGIFSLKTPYDLMDPNIRNVKMESIEYVGIVANQGELNQALLRNELSYNDVINDNYLKYINDFAGSASNVNIGFHNCSDGYFGYDCDSTNKYFISIEGDITGKVILKYKVTWSYEEYEY